MSANTMQHREKTADELRSAASLREIGRLTARVDDLQRTNLEMAELLRKVDGARREAVDDNNRLRVMCRDAQKAHDETVALRDEVESMAAVVENMKMAEKVRRRTKRRPAKPANAVPSRTALQLIADIIDDLQVATRKTKVGEVGTALRAARLLATELSAKRALAGKSDEIPESTRALRDRLYEAESRAEKRGAALTRLENSRISDRPVPPQISLSRPVESFGASSATATHTQPLGATMRPSLAPQTTEGQYEYEYAYEYE